MVKIVEVAVCPTTFTVSPGAAVTLRPFLLIVIVST
jgi:hypothetical protein